MKEEEFEEELRQRRLRLEWAWERNKEIQVVFTFNGNTEWKTEIKKEETYRTGTRDNAIAVLESCKRFQSEGNDLSSIRDVEVRNWSMAWYKFL
jgi:hypothetical protein